MLFDKIAEIAFRGPRCASGVVTDNELDHLIRCAMWESRKELARELRALTVEEAAARIVLILEDK